MKKIYQNPNLEVIKISATTILSGSAGTPDAVVDPNADEVDPGTIESRKHYNAWEDEEEEEEF